MSGVTLLATGGEPFRVRPLAVRVTRRLGQPIRVEVVLGPRGIRGLEDWLAASAPLGPIRVAIGNGFRLPAALVGPSGLVPNADGTVSLVAVATAALDPAAARLPRRVVHTPAHLLELVETLNAAVVPPDLAKRMAAIALGGSDRAAVIQDGVTDLNMTAVALAEYARLEPEPAARPTTLTGGADKDAGTAGRWVVSWCDPEAYRRFEPPAKRTLKLADTDGSWGSWGDALPPWPASSQTAPAIGVKARLHRTCEAAAWEAWVHRDPPFFLDDGGERFVVGITDELAWPGPTWHTAFELAATGVGLPGRGDGWGPKPWSGAAKVTEDTGKPAWVAIELPGFESGANRCRANLVTLSDGPGGDGGLHLPLAAGSIADIHSSGRFDDPAAAAGNRRRTDARSEPPFLSLETAFTLRLDAVTCEVIGAVQFRSDLITSVKGNYQLAARVADLKSERAGIKIDQYADAYQS